MTSGTLGTVVLAGDTSGVLSISGVVGVTAACGEVVQVSVSSAAVVTTTGVERAGILTSVSEIVVSVDAGVGARDLASVQVSFPVLVTKLGKVVFTG